LAIVEVAAKADPTIKRKQGQRTDLQPHYHDNEVKPKRQGTSPEYLAQRIAETAPEIHQRMRWIFTALKLFVPPLQTKKPPAPAEGNS